MTRESLSSGFDSPTRQRILTAALELFGEYGFAATPIRAIASAVGITDAAVLHHFQNKRAILNELWSQSGARVVDRSQAPPIRTREDIETTVLRVLDSSADNYRYSRLLTHQALNGDEQAAAARSAARERWRSVLRQQFSCFVPADADRLADAFATTLSGYMWTAQAVHGPKYEEMVRDPEFRQHAVIIVQRSCPVERFTPAEEPEPPAP